MQEVTLTIKSPYYVYQAIRHVVLKGQEGWLIDALVQSKSRYQVLELLRHCYEGDLEISERRLARMASLFKKTGPIEKTMEVFSMLPATKRLAPVRMRLLSRLVATHFKVWLLGWHIDPSVHQLFRKATFLPDELPRMISKVERSGDHGVIDDFLAFQPGMLDPAEWQRLDNVANHLRARAEKKKQKAAA